MTRSRRGTALTAAGECLADHARVVLHNVDRMGGDIGAFARGLKGRVRVLSNTAALGEHIPQALAGFLAANPDIDVELEERESAATVEAVAAGDADIGIAFDAALSEGVASYPFQDDRLVLVVPRGDSLSARRRVSFKEVVARDFVGLPAASALQRHLAGHAARLGKRMRLRVRVGGFDAVCRMVEAGVGLGIMPAAAARRCQRVMAVAIVRLSDPWCARKLVLCIRQDVVLPAGAKRLLAHLLAWRGRRARANALRAARRG